MNDLWRDFFGTYGPEAVGEDDLFRQVGHTVGRQPIRREIFEQMLDAIDSQLRLSQEDHLLDLCCGNGLFSFELAARVGRLTGIDFVPRSIRTARERKSRPNITYILGDVTAPLSALIGPETFPTKFLMHHSLGYFSPVQLKELLTNIVRHMPGRSFDFLITGIPDDASKWSFYDTPERRALHLSNEERSPGTNDGLGRWWRAEEIESVCVGLGSDLRVTERPSVASNYRMDVLIRSAAQEPAR